jgi:DNA-binding beta-propeller fold protein YncE
VVAPNGRSVYVVDVFADTISQFTVQPGTGRLTPKRPAAVRAENNPAGIAVAPNGKFVYVANLQQQDHADDQQQPPVRVAGLIAEDLFQRASHAITTSSEPCSPIHRQNSVNQIEFRNTATTARTVCHGSGSSRGPCLRRPPRSSANT